MKFSLILGTLNRKKEIENFLESLHKQSYKNFELIIVDQNKKGYLDSIIQKYKNKIKIKHIFMKSLGLSRARNVGTPHATGDIYTFTDDDCEYAPDTLEKVAQFFRNNKNIDVLNIRVIDKKTKRVSAGCKRKEPTIITIGKLHEAASVALFFKKNVVKEIGLWDEGTGINSGTKYGSCADTDYTLRTIYRGFKIKYTPGILVYHPERIFNSREVFRKQFRYGTGFGYLFKKHIFKYNKKILIIHLFKYLLGIFLLSSFNFLKRDLKQSKRYYMTLKGTVKGFLL